MKKRNTVLGVVSLFSVVLALNADDASAGRQRGRLSRSGSTAIGKTVAQPISNGGAGSADPGASPAPGDTSRCAPNPCIEAANPQIDAATAQYNADYLRVTTAFKISNGSCVGSDSASVAACLSQHEQQLQLDLQQLNEAYKASMALISEGLAACLNAQTEIQK